MSEEGDKLIVLEHGTGLRKFNKIAEWSNYEDAARTMLNLIEEVGNPGLCFYVPGGNKFRISTPDYVCADGELAIGTYAPGAKVMDVVGDIGAALGLRIVREKKTKKVTTTERVTERQVVAEEETETHAAQAPQEIPVFIESPPPVSVLPVVAAPVEALPPPAPTRSARDIRIAALAAERDRLDGEIALSELMLEIVDNKGIWLQDILRSYADIMEDTSGEFDDLAERARNLASLIERVGAGSPFRRVVELLEGWAECNGSCYDESDWSKQARDARQDEADCLDFADIFRGTARRTTD